MCLPTWLTQRRSWRWVVTSGFVICGTVLALPTTAYTKKLLYDEDLIKTLKDNTKLGGYDDVANQGPVVTAALIINLLLGLLGVLCLCLAVYAGFLWMTARGNEQEIKKAKDILAGTAVGMLVVLSSYGVMSYVFNSVINAAN